MKQLKSILCLVLLACLAFGNALAADSLPYDCYNYDHWNNILYTPAPYVPDGLVSGATLRFEGAPIGAFRNPQDLCVSPDGDDGMERRACQSLQGTSFKENKGEETCNTGLWEKPA